MWIYKKALQFPVKIRKPDANLAKIIITQFGGPNFIWLYRYFQIKSTCQILVDALIMQLNLQRTKKQVRQGVMIANDTGVLKYSEEFGSHDDTV